MEEIQKVFIFIQRICGKYLRSLEKILGKKALEIIQIFEGFCYWIGIFSEKNSLVRSGFLCRTV